MERIGSIRKRLIEVPAGLCADRAVILTKGYQQYAADPIVIKRAKSLKMVLEEMTLYMDEEQLLCGSQASHPRYAPICPEFALDWVIDELDEFASRPGDAFTVSQKVKDQLRGIQGFWKGKTLLDRVMESQTTEVLKDTRVKVLGWMGNVTSGEGHIVPDYPTILGEGLPGTRQRIEDCMEALSISDPKDLEKRTFYRAALITLEGVSAYMERYAALAVTQSDIAPEPRRQELLKMAEICRILQKRAPASFYEAVQLVWFIHVILHIETNGHSLSLGRIDQYLFPFYQNDLNRGAITRDFALELIECLYLAIYTNNKVRPWSNSRFQMGYPTYQNICLGGSDLYGNDQTNALSFLFLDALGEIRLSEPNVYVRCHSTTDYQFLQKAVEVIKTGIGMPAFVGDKVITKALMLRGVSREDAYNYATMGCTEVLVPGKWGYKVTGKGKVNLLKILEISLYGGLDPRSGEKILEGVTPLEECRSYEDVVRAYRQVLEHYIELEVSADNINDLAMEELVPDAFTAILIQDCIGRGKTIKEGGAIYDMVSGLLSGVVDVGDSLYAIKKLVFEDGRLTTAQLKEALSTNFAGPEGAEIHALLREVPEKYGNDNDAVDQVVAEVMRYYIEKIGGYKNTRYGRGPVGGHFMACTVNITSNVPSGAVVGATPNGRRDGEATSEGISPRHGSERFGPTAVIKSVTKLPTAQVTGGQLFNMRFSPLTLERPEQIEKFLAMLLTLFKLNGWHVQFNVVSDKVLRDAQQNPQNYRDLVVRVAGYSALFTALDKLTQDDIIQRSQYSL